MDEQEQQQAEPTLSALDEMRLRRERRERAVEDLRGKQAQLAAVKEAAAKKPTFMGETGKAVWGAGVDLATETALFAKDAARYILPIDGLLLGKEHADASARAFNESVRAGAEKLAPENETLVGSGARGLLQFMVPYVGWAKAARIEMGAETFLSATGRGFAIDYALFDPTQGNLSKLIKELRPETQSVVLDFLATDPDDDEALARLKNGLEGVALGTALEGIFRVGRWALGKKKIDEAFERADAKSTPIEDIKTQAAEAAVETKRLADEAAERAKKGEPVKTAEGDEVVLAEKDLLDDLRSGLKVTPEIRAKLNDLLMAGDDEAAAEVISKDFNFDTIDWSKIESADDISKLIRGTSEIIAEHIDEVKGGVQSHETTKRLANLVGVTGEQVHELFKDVRGDKGITARFHAAQRTLLASAKEVFRLRDLAKANPADLAAKAAVMRQLELHAALQAEIKGAQTEIARALNGMAIIKAEAADGFREFDMLNRTFGGKGGSPKSFNKMLDDLLDAKSLDDLNAKIRDLSRAERIRNVFVEYVINAMLSSPKTHIINFTSNVLNTFLYSGDRLIGGAYRRVAHGDKAAWREAKTDLLRKFSSLDEAFKLAKQAWKDGAPVSDKRQRLEFQTRKAIAMDGDSWLASAVNTLGNVVRIPGRLLITGDEFFKTINRNAEISVLAFRKADELATKQGLEIGTDAYEKFVTKAMRQLSDPGTMTPTAREIRSQAIEKSRLTTFQESPMTGAGQKMESLINHNAFVKLVVAPFFRTPMNILRQGIIDRTPLGLILKETRETALHGSPREQAEVIARMTSGVAAMAAFWAFTDSKDGAGGNVQIIGKVPYDSSAKAAGVLDYSIRFGDKWYQFNRLDPVGMWLGMVADARTHADHATDDEKTYALMQGAMAGFLNNVTNKTWAKSLADIYDFIEGLSTGEPAATDRAVAQFWGNQAGKLIPQLAKSAGNVALEGDERVARESWTFFDALNAQLPVLSRDVPPRHDALGRPITWDNSAASLVNPFAISDNPTSPIEKELMRLSITLRAMPKNLGGGLMDLTAEEYSKMTGLVGSLQISREGNLEATLNKLVSDPDYSEWTDERKALHIKKYIEAARTAARLTMLKDPAMQKRFKDAKLTEISAFFSGD